METVAPLEPAAAPVASAEADGESNIASSEPIAEPALSGAGGGSASSMAQRSKRTKGKRGRNRGIPLALSEPKIGRLIHKLTFKGSATTSSIHPYNGDHNQEYQTIHRHFDPTRPEGSQRWDTLAHQDWTDGVRAEYNATTDAIVDARHYY